VSYNYRDSSDDDEISLALVWQIVWSRKWLIASCAVACGAIGVALALTATPIFRAQVVATAANEQNAPGVTSIATQLGTLAGVSFRAGTSPAQEAVAFLRSQRLVEEFITRRDLVPLLAPDEPERKTLWWAALRFRSEILGISEDISSGTITVSVEWTDPQTASDWANGFVALANELMRVRAMDEATRSIEYLEKQLESTDVVEIEKALYTLIESQTKTLMLTNARPEYSFKVVDPARPPEFRDRPQRTLMVLFACFIGFLLGALAAFAHHFYTQSRTGPQQT
jgi:uncharacterized protein involved in exopolysaccharide biosynthesis